MTNLPLRTPELDRTAHISAHMPAAARLPRLMCFLACVISFLSACTDQRPRSPDRICLLVGISRNDALWPILQAGARAYAATVPSVQIKAIAPEKLDPVAQADLVRRNLGQPVYAVAIHAVYSEHTKELVSDLANRGIPVVLIGQDIPGSGRFGYVGWDQYELGKALADALNIALDERPSYMVLHAGQQNRIYATRLRGFTARMNRFIRPKQLKSLDCKANPAVALQIICEQSRRYRNLGAFVSMADWPIHADLPKLQNCLPAKTSLVLPDAMPRAWPLIERGVCRAAVATEYGRWGYEAVSLCELAFHRATQPNQRRITPPRIVHAENLDDFKEIWRAWAQGRIRPAKPTLTTPPRSITLPIGP